MYQKTAKQLELENFDAPFGGKLRCDNRWVLLADLVPWDYVEEIYAASFDRKLGAPAISSRIAFGALLIREELNITDEETAEQIRETAYLQYLLGFRQYRDERPFDPSMMVYFRKRFGPDGIEKINKKIVMAAQEQSRGDDSPPRSGSPTKPSEQSDLDTVEEKVIEPPVSLYDSPKKGKLIADATCCPAYIRYPTDVSLLNEARENAERIIDYLCAVTGNDKPRTYRENARRDFLRFIKNKKPRQNKVRRAIKSQLQYIKRDLGHIEVLLAQEVVHDTAIGFTHSTCAQETLTNTVETRLKILKNVYQQQLELYETGSTASHDRIVSFSQPHVRAIVRGKTGNPVEFGNKFSLIVIDGFCIPCELSWNAYNEGSCLQNHIDDYRRMFGYYPESVHVDKIYCTQSNRRFCDARGIRISGRPLGRPPKETETNRAILRAKEKQRRADEITRIEVEGKFGVAKRTGELGRVRTKLEDTSEAVIHLVFLVINLRKLRRKLLFCVQILRNELQRLFHRLKYFPTQLLPHVRPHIVSRMLRMKADFNHIFAT